MRKINYAIQKNGNDRKKVELFRIFQERIFERRKKRKRATKESDFKSKISSSFSLLPIFSFSKKESEIERERGKRIMREKRKKSGRGKLFKSRK